MSEPQGLERPEFKPFPKMARLSRDIVITEKLDGTNAQVHITEVSIEGIDGADLLTIQSRDQTVIAVQIDFANRRAFVMRAGSRNRWIWPGNDNAAFALWVEQNSADLFRLGPGAHFGEWYGKGIQCGYGLDHRRFALFNVARWEHPASRPACCDVVPTLYRGPFDMNEIQHALDMLNVHGSVAAPGFMRPEGIIVYHTAANIAFKKTILKDEVPKSLAA